jgi:hypothetical protein
VEALEPRRMLNAAGFVDVIDNPFMPLTPGATWVYKGFKEGAVLKQRTVVQGYTKTIRGVTCTVVLDRGYEDGELVERTHDFFAQDDKGNVWYFGEKSREIENGVIVSFEGSWEHGVDGAKAGIIMEADPQVGDVYFQENAPDVAEDQAEVLTLHAHAKTPFAAFKNCLETREFTALEPDLAETKFYARGIGFVKGQSVAGEIEVLKLVSYTISVTVQ